MRLKRACRARPAANEGAPKEIAGFPSSVMSPSGRLIVVASPIRTAVNFWSNSAEDGSAAMTLAEPIGNFLAGRERKGIPVERR